MKYFCCRRRAKIHFGMQTLFKVCDKHEYQGKLQLTLLLPPIFFFFLCRTDPTPKVSTHRQRTLSPRARSPVNAESDKAIRKYIASSADAAPVHRKKQNYPLSRSNPLMPPPTHPADAIKSDSAVGVNYFEFPFFFAMRRRPFETPRRPLNGPLSLTGDS